MAYRDDTVPASDEEGQSNFQVRGFSCFMIVSTYGMVKLLKIHGNVRWHLPHLNWYAVGVAAHAALTECA